MMFVSMALVEFASKFSGSGKTSGSSGTAGPASATDTAAGTAVSFLTWRRL